MLLCSLSCASYADPPRQYAREALPCTAMPTCAKPGASLRPPPIIKGLASGSPLLVPEAFVPHPVAGAAAWPVRVFGCAAQLGIVLLCQARRLHQHSSSLLQHTVCVCPLCFSSTIRPPLQYNNRPSTSRGLGIFFPLSIASSFCIPQCTASILYLASCDSDSRPCRLHVACPSQQSEPAELPTPASLTPPSQPQHRVFALAL